MRGCAGPGLLSFILSIMSIVWSWSLLLPIVVSMARSWSIRLSMSIILSMMMMVFYVVRFWLLLLSMVRYMMVTMMMSRGQCPGGVHVTCSPAPVSHTQYCNHDVCNREPDSHTTILHEPGFGHKIEKKTKCFIQWASWKKGLNLRINSLPSNLHDEILETWVK